MARRPSNTLRPVDPGRASRPSTSRTDQIVDPITGAIVERRLMPGTRLVEQQIARQLPAPAMKPLPGNRPLVDSLCRHATAPFGEPVEAWGTPLYTDARLFSERGIPAVIYGAGPRTALESSAKRADVQIVREVLRRATKVVARTRLDLLKA